MKWKRGDIAIYQGDILESTARLSRGATYVVNAVGRAHDATYIQIVDDDRQVLDLLATHFRPRSLVKNG